MAFITHKLRMSHKINFPHLPSLIGHRFCSNPEPPQPQCQPNVRTAHPLSKHGTNSWFYSFQRMLLPPEISKNVVTLTCDSTAKGGVCHVYLVGAKHSSKESAEKAKAVVDFVKPQGLYFGLCRYRASNLTSSLDYWCESLEIKLDKNPLKKLYYWFIVNFLPRGEFPAALEGLGSLQFPAPFDAQKYVKALKLADRPTEIKYKRNWPKRPLLDKLNANDEDFEFDKFNPQIQILSKHFPTAIETILHESDRFMATTLLEMAEEYQTVVAVVGEDHLRGIEENWGHRANWEELVTYRIRGHLVYSYLSS